MDSDVLSVWQPRHATDPIFQHDAVGSVPARTLSITVKVSVGAGGLATMLGQ